MRRRYKKRSYSSKRSSPSKSYTKYLIAAIVILLVLVVIRRKRAQLGKPPLQFPAPRPGTTDVPGPAPADPSINVFDSLSDFKF